MKPEKVCVLVGACAVLHNIAVIRNEPMDDENGVAEFQQPEIEPYHGPETGRVVREHICNSFF